MEEESAVRIGDPEGSGPWDPEFERMKEQAEPPKAEEPAKKKRPGRPGRKAAAEDRILPLRNELLAQIEGTMDLLKLADAGNDERISILCGRVSTELLRMGDTVERIGWTEG